jgi:type I restriction enzyme R subunit
LAGEYNEALSCLKFTRSLGIWFHQTFARDPDFKSGPFVPPPDPRRETHELAEQLEALRQRVREAEAKAVAANASAEEQARARAAAEEIAQREREDRWVWEELPASRKPRKLASGRNWQTCKPPRPLPPNSRQSPTFRPAATPRRSLSSTKPIPAASSTPS